MKHRHTLLCLSALLLAYSGCRKESSLSVSLSDKFEGKKIELMNYADSTVIDTQTIRNGKAVFQGYDTIRQPLFTVLMIDGRARAYYVLEEGKALITDSMSVASGTPLNDRMAALMVSLDSIESLENQALYNDFVLRKYNENKDNALADYFGIEWLKYATPQQVDSLVAAPGNDFVNSYRAKNYIRFALLRASTAPGKPYKDFSGEDANGRSLKLSGFVRPGEYTLVDFWASWCPWCIKELPQIAELYNKWNGKGVNIVAVAVRDTPADTNEAVKKHSIKWPVIYNTQKTPYELYGFSGIPHHLLIGPDGKIVSSGETIAKIDEYLSGKHASPKATE